MEGTKRETGDGAEAGRVDDGGQAFPGIEHRSSRDGDHIENWFVSEAGMTLRDYFAGRVVAGVKPWDGHKPSEWAKYAYDIADAMIQARKARG